ncbi:GrpB family protein [Enterococcus raffinosus]|uniref:GrpB family protein n=1 Tax=Enterococcus raffinosus TaxID=71452 RepID=A0AAW8T8V4_9ENTE|nr:GrpB family protein [Enterococcus raffinosus]MDT2523714.1 GrpB family protein [Enterococcus raffinosus]MDT2529683.1 GrpB family protein [Enterococcus raffinosus]MDT2534305.1 GrpB family protein [Enterococcus raffinosus]MDT2544851.1 GrpB family protein [Enterococcus raffinosus]MDT2556797.1 GrpB family protein [Enterococcus raffinosus]
MKKLEDMTLAELWELFPIVLKEHSPKYAEWYEEEKQNLTELLADFGLQRINHIGSTSVEGLIAKPIVDILLELPEGYALDRVAELLQNAGWILMIRKDKKQTLDLNKGYTPAGFAEKVYHLHVRALGDWDELYFRDYLRKYPKAARQYEELKRSLKEKYEHNRDAYTEAKTAFVQQYSQAAREEFGTRYLAK